MIKKKRVKDFFSRTFWGTESGRLESRNGGYGYSTTKETVIPKSCQDALLVGSLREDGTHAPVIDLDFSAELIPSTTEGHFHLYLNKALTPKEHEKLLKVLYEVGIIEYGFYHNSLKRKQAHVLMPGINRDNISG